MTKVVYVNNCRECPHRSFSDRPNCELSGKELPNKESAVGGRWGTDVIPAWCGLKNKADYR